MMGDEKIKRIALKKCKDGFLYEINSRNLVAGVFNAKTKGFMGIRNKFGHDYLFEEFHWDTGEPYGTVHPIRLIEKCPLADIRGSLETVCRNCKTLVEFRETDKEKRTGVWGHLGETDCKDASPMTLDNTALFKYLEPITRVLRKKANKKWSKYLAKMRKRGRARRRAEAGKKTSSTDHSSEK